MYWAMRFATFVQLAMTMSTVVNVVSRISGIEMPSTPMLKSAWMDGYPGRVLDELHFRGAGLERRPTAEC